MAKPTTTMTNTTTTDGLTLPVLSEDKLAKLSSKLTGSSWRPDNKYCQMIAINSQPPQYGYYIEDKNLPLSGWYGLTNHKGVMDNVILGGNKTTGLLFPEIKCIIVDASPRFVEMTADGVKFYNDQLKLQAAGKECNPLGLHLAPRAGALIDIFCDYDGSYNAADGTPYTGSEVHNGLKNVSEKDFTALRTFYLVYLLSDTNELLHANPIVLSVKGLAAAALGQSIETLGKSLLSQMSTHTGDIKLSKAKIALDYFRDVIITITLQGEGKVNGKGSKNYITTPKGFDIDSIEDQSLSDMIQASAELSDGFSWKFAKQVEDHCGFHSIGGTLGNANALPAAIDVAVTEPLPF